MRSSVQARHALHRLASTQGGYFTSRQAAELGYQRQHVYHHIKAGSFEREGHGLFRLTTLPLEPCTDLQLLSVWSQDREHHPQAVVSHHSAMCIHELGDAYSDGNHLTVPPGFRRKPPTPCILHQGELDPETETQWHGGFRVTTPLRTLVDVAGEPSFEGFQLNRAVGEALERGVVLRPRLEEVVHELRGYAKDRLSAALAEVDWLEQNPGVVL